MILAVSRFRVLHGREDAVQQAFANRPHLVDGERGFLGMEVFTNRADPALFYLVTRWSDGDSFRSWHHGPRHHAAHKGMPRPLKLDPAFTELLELERITDAAPGLGALAMDAAPVIASFLEGSCGVSTIVADTDGVVRACNRAAADLLRTSDEELVGTSLWARMTADDVVSVQGLVERRERSRASFLVNLVDSAGSVVTLECRLDVWPGGFLLLGEAPARHDDRIAAQMLELNNELASQHRETARQRKELEAALKQLQRAQAQLVHMEKMASLGQLTAGIAHEINNPLSYVHGNQAGLRQDFDNLLAFINVVGAALPAIETALPTLHASLLAKAGEIDLPYLAEQVPAKLAASLEGLERVRQTVLDLRSFSRLDEGSRKDVDLADGVRATLRFLANVARERNVECATTFGKMPLTPCAPGPLQQAIANVVLNAIQASPPNGRVDITARAEGDWHVVEVVDRGAGIAPGILPKIFDPFFTTKPVGEGNGLGLTIAHQVVSAHSGTIAATSATGGGTCVTIRVPAADSAPLRDGAAC